MIKRLISDVLASMGIYQRREDQVYGILAEFPNPGALYEAVEQTRLAGFKRFDAHSPFPIHGMDKAFGLGNSIVGYFTIIGGVTGLAAGTLLQWWTGSVDYPLNISGKPFFAVEPSVPVMFELTILFAALTAVGSMFALNGLPRPYNPLFYSKNFLRATDDGFFLHIAANDARFDVEKTQSFLKRIGGAKVEVIRDSGESDV